METEAAQGTNRYIGLIPRFSAMLHKRVAKIIMVEELEVICVIRLITRQQRNTIATAETPTQ